MSYEIRKPGHPLHLRRFPSMRAARRAYCNGKGRSYLSDDFPAQSVYPWEHDIGDDTIAWCVYGSAKERDDDYTGAHAVWIVRVPR